MLAQKIAGWAKRVLSSTRANGSSPTSSVTRSSRSGARRATWSRISGVWLPWPGNSTAGAWVSVTKLTQGTLRRVCATSVSSHVPTPRVGGCSGVGWGVSGTQQRREALRDGRAAVELRRGQAHGAPAVGGEHEVAFAVGLEGAPVAVVEPAVELGDQAVLRPVQVDLVAADEAVADRLGQAVLVEDLAQVALEP